MHKQQRFHFITHKITVMQKKHYLLLTALLLSAHLLMAQALYIQKSQLYNGAPGIKKNVSELKTSAVSKQLERTPKKMMVMPLKVRLDELKNFRNSILKKTANQSAAPAQEEENLRTVDDSTT